MINLLLKRLVGSSLTCSYPPDVSVSVSVMKLQLLRTNLKHLSFIGRGFSSGLNLALARKGILVKDKAFHNLNSSELQQLGATIPESLSGLPLHIRGNVLEGASAISRTQFNKLLMQVTSHISSISNVFVHDGAIGSSPKCDAKVRVISDSPSAVLSLSNVLWKTPSRAVSHDSCPLTVYVATSIGPGITDIIGLGPQGTNGFIVGDVDHSSLVLCGKAFLDTVGTKEALASLSGPIISARGGLPLSGRLLVIRDSVVLLFAPENTIKSCADKLVSADAGVILSSLGAVTLFQNGSSVGSNLVKAPAAVIVASSDSSGNIPSVSKLSPGQAAYHFLAGYQNGKFLPAYSKGPSSIDPLDLANAFLSKLKVNQIPSFLVNVRHGEKSLTGKGFIKLVESTLSKNIPPLQTKACDLQEKYKSFLSGKFQKLPEELSF
ncbi:Phosphoenolpyruvate carboxykinase, ATP-utilizing [Parasponia andersonii]|uniref:phosphoenolpyruvate carboxykinase (ATP) n=1 Tax=Parasponia andersonii TaxID=3476 RepID=A0A2P5DW83_PARAD|nr:Phosphoenolpyruvate carboxykinase, ATP-utilizing [Parasponia andersonii]